MRHTLHSDKGSSLLEVTLAVVVLGLLATVLVGGIGTMRVVGFKSNSAVTFTSDLNEAVQELTLRPFTVCSPSNPNPYAVPAKPSGIGMVVQVLDPTTQEWKPCTDETAASGKPASYVQRIEIKTAFNNATITRYVTKIKTTEPVTVAQ